MNPEVVNMNLNIRQKKPMRMKNHQRTVTPGKNPKVRGLQLLGTPRTLHRPQLRGQRHMTQPQSRHTRQEHPQAPKPSPNLKRQPARQMPNMEKMSVRIQ